MVQLCLGQESFAFAGFLNLNLTAIFQAGIYLASSGAIMDLAVDISSALEDCNKQPNVKRSDLIKSGMNIGKASGQSNYDTFICVYGKLFIHFDGIHGSRYSTIKYFKFKIYSSKKYSIHLLDVLV